MASKIQPCYTHSPHVVDGFMMSLRRQQKSQKAKALLKWLIGIQLLASLAHLLHATFSFDPV